MELGRIGDSPVPIDVPLWFVRDLMVMVVITPIIYFLIRKTKGVFVTCVAVVWFLMRGEAIECDGYITTLTTALLFFSAGALFGIYKIDFVSLLKRFTFIPFIYVVFAVVDTVTHSECYNSYIHDFGILVGIIASIVITVNIVEKGKGTFMRKLSSSAFFVYALHGLILSAIAKLCLVLFMYQTTRII